MLNTADFLLASFYYFHFQFRISLQEEYYDNLKSKALVIAEMVAGKKTDEAEFKIQARDAPGGVLSGDCPENISIYSVEGKILYRFNPVPDDIKKDSLEDVDVYGECHFYS